MPKPIAKIVYRLEELSNFDPRKYGGGETVLSPGQRCLFEEMQQKHTTGGGTFDFSRQATLLHHMLQLAVPMWFLEIEGLYKTLSPEQVRDEFQRRTERCSQVLAEKGDALMFQVKGDSANAFNRLAEGIACMAYCPGGVTAFGSHWERKGVKVSL